MLLLWLLLLLLWLLLLLLIVLQQLLLLWPGGAVWASGFCSRQPPACGRNPRCALRLSRRGRHSGLALCR